LVKDPQQRLGSYEQDINLIKNHPFFHAIDWELIQNRQITAPYTPILDSKTDLKHFDPYIHKEALESPLNENPASQHAFDQSNFKDFSYDPSFINISI